MTVGVDVSSAVALLKEYEASVFTGDPSTDQYYENLAYKKLIETFDQKKRIKRLLIIRKDGKLIQMSR